MSFLKPYIGYVVVAAILAAAGSGYMFGHSVAKGKGDLAVSRLEKSHADERTAQALAHANAAAEARKTEQSLRDDIDAVQGKYQLLEEEAEREKAEHDSIIADLRDGSRRLSIAVRNCSSTPGGTGSAASGGSGAGVSRAELEPETAGRILGIGRDGDRNTRERNACVEAYNKIRARLNSAP